MKKRVNAPLPGVYTDYRAATVGDASVDDLFDAAKANDVRVILAHEPRWDFREGILLGSLPEVHPLPQFPNELAGLKIETRKPGRQDEKKFKQYPDEVFALARGTLFAANWTVTLRHASTHLLARGLTGYEIRAAIDQGRAYAAHDWLCDPGGFYFIADNNLGAFDIGDIVPLTNGTTLQARFPVPAKIRLLRDGAVVAEENGTKFSYHVTAQGDYRIEALLTVDGEEQPWIYSNPIKVGAPPDLSLPVGRMSQDVEVHKDIPYVADDLAKHKLDVYVPKDKKNFPVMIFLHGGFWRSGDRSLYPLFGSRFAEAGIAVVVPSYRLMPQNPHPAQIEDAAAAFAWVYHNIAEYGGDVTRIYVVGHSAGGHLAALLALAPAYLKTHGIPVSAIRGVASMSGIYDVGMLDGFTGVKGDDPSPEHHVHAQAPPFLITYCQWDYLGLPMQARKFAEKLKGRFVDTKLVYVQGESHISEIVDTLKQDDATAREILSFVK
jgi:acetyl esterase/lipase